MFSVAVYKIWASKHCVESFTIEDKKKLLLTR